MGNILLVTFGTEGDVLPFVRIGRALGARGHEVTLLTHCAYETRARAAGCDFAAVDTPDEFEQFIQEGSLASNLHESLVYFQRHLLPKVLPLYEMIRDRYREGDTVLVFRSMPGLASWMAAESLGIPRLSVFLSPSYVANADFLAAIFDSVSVDLNRIRAEIGLSPVQHWQSWWTSCERYCGLWPDWFAGPRSDWVVDVEPLGFVVDEKDGRGELPTGAKEMLDDDDGSILIAGSSSTFFVSSEFYTVGAQACHLSGRKGLLVARHRKLAPDVIPDGVSHFEHLPFASLMPRVGAVIHHGGIGTAAQALASGIPQVVLAAGADRPDNARRLERLGVAEFVPPPRWHPETVAEALKRVMESPQVGERCQELARRVKAANALTAVCDVVESLLSYADLDTASLSIAKPEIPLAADDWDQTEKTLHTSRVSELTDHLSQERLELLILWLQEDQALAPPESVVCHDGGEVATGPVPLTPAQGWFFSRALSAPHWWNIGHVFKLGRAADLSLLEQALHHLVLHHDALRARFSPGEGDWQQVIPSPENRYVSITCIDVSQVPRKERDNVVELAKKQSHRSLDFSEGPLMRLVLFDYGPPKPYHALLIVHHTLIDNVSLQIVLEDLFTAYHQLDQGKPVQLFKTVSLKRWSERVHAYVESPTFQQKLDTWLDLPWKQTAPLPVDYAGEHTVDSLRSVWASLGADETDFLLRGLPQKHAVHIFDALLMALVDTIARWTGNRWVIINTINSGRTMDIPELDLDLSRTVGWIATSSILPLQHKNTGSPLVALRAIQEQRRDLPQDGIPIQLARLSSRYSGGKRFPAYATDLPLNYVGRAIQPTVDSALVRPMRMPATGQTRYGADRETCLLGCVVSIQGKRLITMWSYSENVYKKTTIENLSNNFVQVLRALIADCQSVP